MNNTIIIQIRDSKTNHISSSFVCESLVSGTEQPTIECINTILPLILNKHSILIENNEAKGVELNLVAIQRRIKSIKENQ